MGQLDAEVRRRMLHENDGPLLIPGRIPDVTLTGGAILGRQMRNLA